MVMGRAISAAMGTATVLVVYFVGKRVSNPIGGLLAAALLATTVVHIAESHSFRVDLAMMFFVSLAWLFALRIAEQGRWRDYLWAGVFVGGGDRIQVLGGVHPRRRRRGASGRATPSPDVDGRPWLARVDRSRAESARR